MSVGNYSSLTGRACCKPGEQPMIRDYLAGVNSGILVGVFCGCSDDSWSQTELRQDAKVAKSAKMKNALGDLGVLARECVVRHSQAANFSCNRNRLRRARCWRLFRTLGNGREWRGDRSRILGNGPEGVGSADGHTTGIGVSRPSGAGPARRESPDRVRVFGLNYPHYKLSHLRPRIPIDSKRSVV